MEDGELAKTPPGATGSSRIRPGNSPRGDDLLSDSPSLLLPTHDELVERAGRWLRSTRRCGVVLLEPGYGSPREIPDAIGWRSGRHSILVECKTSRRDFLADRDKPSRRRERAGFSETAPDDGPGGERWYLAPVGVLSADDIPEGWGLLELKGGRVYCRREAERRERSVASLTAEMTTLVGLARAAQLREEGINLSDSRHMDVNLGNGG